MPGFRPLITQLVAPVVTQVKPPGCVVTTYPVTLSPGELAGSHVTVIEVLSPVALKFVGALGTAPSDALAGTDGADDPMTVTATTLKV